MQFLSGVVARCLVLMRQNFREKHERVFHESPDALSAREALVPLRHRGSREPSGTVNLAHRATHVEAALTH